MKKWNFIVNNTIVHTIDQQGRSKSVFYWVVLDKVYSLTQLHGATVDVCSSIGNQEYSYA